ncbi:hypothetical protein IQ26_06680 [Mesorhizobium tianshanense]|uniref:Uncharacterized protein n=1 Tax=Mesorhizobium tianshanense TaxID=39844 RepID=A0A562MQV7_9HYPH|nr:hypothetical protein IQ26_06680 [Mesorhizobium tianshanense]
MTGHGLNLGVNASHLSDPTSQRVVVRIFCKKAIYIGKKNDDVGVYHLRDPCRQPIIVAKTDLGRCGRVVLVDNGYGANFEKLLKG